MVSKTGSELDKQPWIMAYMPVPGPALNLPTSPTNSVDNFVKNLPNNPFKTASGVALNRLVKNQAVKNALKTIAYALRDVLPLPKHGQWLLSVFCGHLFATGACGACDLCFKNRGNDSRGLV